MFAHPYPLTGRLLLCQHILQPLTLKGGETMSEFAQRYYTLNQYYLDHGYDALTASQLAVAKIQHEVRTSGRSYNCEFKVA